MRPIPAPRLGDTHGLLRAVNQRERLRLDEFITEFSIEELFPPGLENALGRTRQFISFVRAAGLLNEDRGSVELTEIGKRYVRAGDEAAVFDVAPDQAKWLRRQLRERHMTDSIYHGAAIGLSLYASNPADFHVSRLDFGRALAHLGRAGWDNENTLEGQGERYTTFLRDLELVDDESRLTETGTRERAELTVPSHLSLRDLAGQLNPGGPEAAQADGAAEWAERSARYGAATVTAPVSQPAAGGRDTPSREPAPSGARIFISYRREETSPYAGRLFEALEGRFGKGQIFMDLEIELGVDFVDEVEAALRGCTAFLAVIGPRWAAADESGQRRIDDPDDFVRLELESALKRTDLRVIPILVQGARMPSSSDLPEDLRHLARRNALELTDARWRYDFDRLVQSLSRLLADRPSAVSNH